MPAPLYSGANATEPSALITDASWAPEARHSRGAWTAFLGGLLVVLALGAAALYVAVRLRGR